MSKPDLQYEFNIERFNRKVDELSSLTEAKRMLKELFVLYTKQTAIVTNYLQSQLDR